MTSKEKHSIEFDIKDFNSIIIGSGAAGLNCALHLSQYGIKTEEIAIITDNLKGGTSFNTGSDKQTYYKLSITGDQLDSPYRMAVDLFKGGAMHGDIALIEATNSVKEFFHLVHLGVPFPHDSYGSYVGYKTDYDPRQRATSAGPLTSQIMCEHLLNEVNRKKIPIFDNHYAIKLIVNYYCPTPEICGVICLKNQDFGTIDDSFKINSILAIFRGRNIILATGGPAQIYKNSVYPISHNGTSILAAEAGCVFQNLTESQFGLASIDFRWNLSGSYQQVIPRYYSIGSDEKVEVEFLNDYFPSFNSLSTAIFLKGYQWPFNSMRLENYGSSLIDLAVYNETENLKRRVFIDFRQNPKEYDYDVLDDHVKKYLVNSNAVEDLPINRLSKLNKEAIALYKKHGIDLYNIPIQIAVCNQHLNGGIKGDIWWETSIKHLFAIGEINGSHGVHRPGGSALNSGQVGGLRAAQKIGNVYNKRPKEPLEVRKLASSLLRELNSEINSLITKKIEIPKELSPRDIWEQIKDISSKFCGILRPITNIQSSIQKTRDLYKNLKNIINISNFQDLVEYFRLKDALLMLHLILNSIKNYHEINGSSRGSYLLIRPNSEIKSNETLVNLTGFSNQFNFIKKNNRFQDKVQTIQFVNDNIKIDWESVREIPKEETWFESIWKEFQNGAIFN